MSRLDERDTDIGVVGEFLSGFLGGTAGLFGLPGQVVIYAGWGDAEHVLMVCAIIGLPIGVWMAIGSVRERQSIKHRHREETLID